MVFATVYDRYALQAFDLHTVDYLLKPFSDDRFEQALGSAKRQLRESETEVMRARMTRLLREIERTRDAGGRREPEGEGTAIEGTEADGDYVRLHAGERSFLHRETMYRLAKRLDPSEFVRVHR